MPALGKNTKCEENCQGFEACVARSSKRAFANFPRQNPTKEQILERFSRPAFEGGWGAKEISEDEICALEPDFRHVQVVVDQNAKKIAQELADRMHRNSNRKGVPPGDVHSEMWRICMFPQWLPPGASMKWGIGKTQVWVGDLWTKMYYTLMYVIWATNCLPVTTIINYGARIPKSS